MPQNLLTKIYVVRHGEAHSNVNKIVAGHTDMDLTENGVNQAKEQAKNLKSIKFDAAFSSDLIRARRTAEFIATEHQLAVNTTQIIRERNFGEWEGKAETEFYEKNAELFEKLKTLTEQEKQDIKFGEGYESNSEISTRFITFLREIAATYSGKTVLVVCHGSIMRATLMRLGFATYDELLSHYISNAGYFVLESDGVDFFVKETFGIKRTTDEQKTN